MEIAKTDFTSYEIREALQVLPQKVSEGKDYADKDEAIRYVFYKSNGRPPASKGMLKLHNFLSFSENYQFFELVKQNNLILNVIKEIKDIYMNQINRHDLESSEFMEKHMLPLLDILNTGLSAEKFYKRAVALRNNLLKIGKTWIEDKDFDALYKEKEKRINDEKYFYAKLRAVYAPMRKEAKERYQGKDSLGKNMGSRLVRACSQNIMNEIRFTPSLEQCVQNPDASAYIPAIKISLDEAGEKADEKLSMIFKNKSSIAYSRIISHIKNQTSVQQKVLTNMINRYSTQGKKSMTFKTLYTDEKMLKEISDYYGMNRQVKNFILSMRKNYNKSLVSLINEAYNELMRTNGIQN